jgi:hypothetical protein
MALTHDPELSVGIMTETIVRATARAVAEGKRQLAADLTAVFSQFFSSGTELSREATAFGTVMRARGLKRPVAERLLAEALDECAVLDPERLHGQRLAMRERLRGVLGEGWVTSAPIPDRNVWGCLQCLADARRGQRRLSEAMDRALAAEALVERMCAPRASDDPLEPADALVYTMALERFQGRYADLTERQKMLLGEHVRCVAGGGTQRPTLETVTRTAIRDLNKARRDPELSKDPELVARLDEVRDLLERPGHHGLRTEGRLELAMMAVDLLEELKS